MSVNRCESRREMGEDFFSERRNGSVENRFPGELPGYYIELAGIGVWCKWSSPAEYASVTRMLTNTSDYTDISTVYLIRAIATVHTYAASLGNYHIAIKVSSARVIVISRVRKLLVLVIDTSHRYQAMPHEFIKSLG